MASRPTWPTGTRYEYRLEWRAESELAGAGELALTSKTDLEATLAFTSHGPHERGWLLAAAFVDVAKPGVEVLGKTVFVDVASANAQLVGPTAWVVLDLDGGVERIYFDPSAPPAFKHVMQSVASLSHITSAAGDAWTATEPGPSGIARVAYERESASRIQRTRTSYDRILVAPATPDATPELTARAAIVVDARGHLESLVDDESLALRLPGTTTPLYRGTSKFSLTRLSTTRAPVSAVSLENLEQRAPGELVQGGDADRALREQAAAGLTEEQLAEGLARGWGDGEPDRKQKRRWMHRAVALLQLHPELCADVLATFAEGDPAVRLLAFDLLAAAGTVEAQAAMREAFATPGARGLEVDLVQRFSFVHRPTPETVQLVVAAWQTATDRDVASATAYTVGALARRLDADPETKPLAAELDGQLREALAKATTVREREDALAAIGNAAISDTVPLVRELARDPAPEIRSRAAWALRDMHTADARAALVELSTDTDARVARAALKAMERQPLGSSDLEKLERALASRADVATNTALVDLLAAHLRTGAATRRMLEAIADKSTDSHLASRARALLDQI
ncbi:MAG: HEAT repeat domain-containing protein [Myxococcales bacterium]|nr:HEAT repeat domain-containing protein [Myxococcales bacterium]